MLQEEVRKLAGQSQQDEDTPPVMKEAEFREATKHIIAHSRELDQAVTFLHDNGTTSVYGTLRVLKCTCTCATLKYAVLS